MVSVQNLSFSYQQRLIYEHFDLHLAGGLVTLKGPSGCGKTTLLKLLSGNLAADAGQVDFPERSTLVLQEDALFPWLTGLENIRKITGIEESTIRLHPLYDYLRSFIGQKAFQMSYGQRRMVELFRALLYQPRLLCLDEPFNFLDIQARRVMADLLKTAVAVSGQTDIIMSTHYQEDLMDEGAGVYYFDGLFPVTRLFEQNPCA